MPTPLPPPTSTTDVYLAALVERFDALLAALPADHPINVEAARLVPVEAPAPEPTPTPSPRKRAPKPKDAP